MNQYSKIEYEFWKELAKQKEDFTAFRKSEYSGKTCNFLTFEKQSGYGLEVGCGCVSILTDCGKDYIAGDPLYNEYQAICPFKGVVLDGEALNFEDNTFDWIFCVNVIDHTLNPQKMADEMYRVLKPGGKLYFQVNLCQVLFPGHYSLWDEFFVRKTMADFKLAHKKINEGCAGGNYLLYWAEFEKPTKRPRFSIIMPTMNKRQGFIDKSINSILSQTFNNFELIIKNGGDDDVIFPDDQRIVYIKQKDIGIADAMNQGFEISTGQILNESNDDDLMRPNALELVNKYIENYLWLYGQIEFGGIVLDRPWDYQALKTGNRVPQPAAFWTREAYKDVGPMDTENDYAADYEYWLRLGAKFEPYYLRQVLADYILHADQITSRNLAKQSADAERVKQKYA